MLRFHLKSLKMLLLHACELLQSENLKLFDLFGKPFIRDNTNFKTGNNFEIFSHLHIFYMSKSPSSVYTGPDNFCRDKNLHGSTLRFTRDRGNLTNFWATKSTFGTWKEQVLNLHTYCSLSKIRPGPPVPCKRKVEPYKFLSVQKFVRTTCKRGLKY